MAVTGLLRLLKEGRAWSVEELAGRLETSQEDIRRQVEYLEHTGFLRRLDSMGRCAGMRFGLRFRMHTGPGDVRDAGDVGGYKQI